jgi:hypothetical protein
MEDPRRSSAERLRALRVELRALGACGPSALATLAPKLADALALDAAVAFSLRTSISTARADEGIRLGHGSETGASGLLANLDEVVARHDPTGWAWLAPLQPSRADWSRVRAREELRAEGAFELTNPAAAALARVGLGAAAAMRVAICDRDGPMAYVAVFRRAPLGPTQREGLQSLVSPLTERLARDRALATSERGSDALRTHLATIGAPAWIVSAALHVEHANTAGNAQLERERALTLERMRIAVQLRRSAAGLTLTPLVAPGEPVSFLLVQQA